MAGSQRSGEECFLGAGARGWLYMGSKDEDPALKAAGVVAPQGAGGGDLVG